MKVKILLVLAGLFGYFVIFSLHSRCLNNAKEHMQEQRGKGKRYHCFFKTRKFYEDKEGAEAASKFYDGTKCKFCGCDSSEHEDGLVTVPGQPAK